MADAWQTLISVAAIIAAIIALWGYLTKVVHFMDRQKKQDATARYMMLSTTSKSI